MGLIWGVTAPLLYWDVKQMSGHKDDGQSSYREPSRAEKDRPSLSEETKLTQSNETNASLSQETEKEGKCFIQDKSTINLVQILQSFYQGNHKTRGRQYILQN